ncbi:MAG: GNAT family protein [Chloroflexota bacterium]
MIRIDEQLFQGPHICLGPIDHEKDAEVEARWTHDASYLRLLSLKPALPASPAQIKKRYEAIEKEQEQNNLFYFTIRLRPAELAPEAEEPSVAAQPLIGFARLDRIEWTNGNGYIQIGIGDPQDRQQGYGSEALRLLLRFAFGELNLHRLTVQVPEYNPAALRLFQKAGFVEEVRRRQALNRDGRRWDLLHLGLLSSEWEAGNERQ